MTDAPAGERVLRALTNDGSFRVIAARTTATVRGAVAAQGVRGEIARQFGDLLTGSIVVRETMAPQYRVQGILDGPGGKGRLVADAHPDGGTRGLVHPPGEGVALDLALAQLRMSRAMPSGSLHEGIIELPANGGVSEG